MLRRAPLKASAARMKRTRLSSRSRKRKALSSEYVAFTLGIKDRDGWRCRYCRTKVGRLDPHHVVKRSQGGALIDADNVCTLCAACHAWTDAAYGSKTGRLVIDKLGQGGFAFSIVRGASKFQVRAISVARNDQTDAVDNPLPTGGTAVGK